MKLPKLKKYKVIAALYVIIIFVGMFKTYFVDAVETFSMPVAKKNIVIDAGHGGWDPGKVRKDGIVEKNINLAIASKLQKYLEQGGAFVLTTRVEDKALSEKKRQDLKERKNIANEDSVDLMISIHQNSFPKETAKGAQVFYFDKSEESKKLAEIIQAKIKESVDNSNNRVAKANKEYYLLKKNRIPSVIVECGFLSNEEENKKLNDENYQEKIAWAIYMGIIEYYNGE